MYHSHTWVCVWTCLEIRFRVAGREVLLPLDRLAWLLSCLSLLPWAQWLLAVDLFFTGQISERTWSWHLSYFSKCQSLTLLHMQKYTFIMKTHLFSIFFFLFHCDWHKCLMTEKIMINNHILLIIFHLTHHRTKIEGVLGNPITAVVRYSGFCFVWLANNKVI